VYGLSAHRVAQITQMEVVIGNVMEDTAIKSQIINIFWYLISFNHVLVTKIPLRRYELV